MSITNKKANLPWPIILDTEPDRNIDVESIVCTYSECGVSNPPVTVTNKFVNAGIQGSYELMMTIPSAGYFKVHVEIPGDDTYPLIRHTQSVQVMNSTVDDIYNEVKANGGKLDGLKSTLDSLDISSLNSLDEMATGIENQLSSLSELLLDEENDAIVSLKELLKEIKESGNANNSLLSAIQTYVKDATDDIEIMIRGDQYLSDGSTANPFYKKTNVDVMAALQAMNTFITDSVNAIELKISNNVEAARAEIMSTLTNVEAIADANKDLLGHEVFGLSEIMTKLQATDADSKNGIANLASDIQTVSTAIENFKTGVHGKLDSIKTGVDDINRKMDKQSNTIVHM